MERKRSKHASLLLWATVTALLSQNLVLPVMSSATVEDKKNYYPPNPNAGSPPTGSHHTPSHGSGGGHGSRTPSPGGGSSGGTPPANCGNPPSGGHYNPTPSPPTGGGGYYLSPPSSGGGTPSTPTIVSPPTTPIDPGTPSIPVPPFYPYSPPFTCDYWRTHPMLIWGLLGMWGTVGGVFGGTSLPGFGANMSLQQALSNTRTDGLGALYREGTASFLNSMANNKFPYTTRQVRDRFVAALLSNRAAAQAQLFKLANEGRIPSA